MKGLAIFTDASLDPRLKLGVGACLTVSTSFLEVTPGSFESSEFEGRIMLRRYEGASSTELEVRTVIWALEDYMSRPAVPGMSTVSIYSDSQCVTGLLRRRPGLSHNGFRSKRTKQLLKNASIYQSFYNLHDEIGFKVIKVAGHSRLCSRDTIHQIFSLVDREARKGLSLWKTGMKNRKVI